MKITAALALPLLAVALTACATDPAGPGATPEPSPSSSSVAHGPLTLTSTDIGGGAVLADTTLANAYEYCDGPGQSPQLTWNAGPEGTTHFAIHFADVTDGDVHTLWLSYNIPGVATSIETGEYWLLDGDEGRNFLDYEYYIGPCPEWDADHDYELTLFALDSEVGDGGMTLEEFTASSQGHILDQVTLTGVRSGPPAPVS